MNAKEIQMIVELMQDGRRNDRFLRRAEDGHLFTTDTDTYIGNDGSYTVPSVKVPWFDAGTPDDFDFEAEAQSYIDQLGAMAE